MQSFTVHKGRLAVLDRGNVDTDQIIPKQHLKSIERTGFERGLFSDWRYLPDGQDNPEFELNQEENRGASVLLTGNNFGCGSSREHAVWALAQFGFKVIIAPRLGPHPAFADIFRTNAAKNGLLTIELTENETLQLKKEHAKNPKGLMTVDLQGQSLTYGRVGIKFAVEPQVKERLLKGLDDIGITLAHEQDIKKFEDRHDSQMRLGKKA